MSAELRRRSFAKSVSYRIVTIIADLTIIWFLTHRLDITLGVTLLTNLASTLLYYFHERAWNIISWGRKKKKGSN